MTIRQLFKVWCFFLFATLVGVTVCIRWLDIPVALAFLASANRFTGLGEGLSSTILVTGEVVVIIGLAIMRIVRGILPEFAKAVFVASCASLSAFVANDYVLKIVFGRASPFFLLHGVPSHVFNFFQGDQHSSFPSGHMVMATAFGVAISRLQRRMLPIAVILLGIGAIALVVGDWHFIGDIIAGAFVGGTAGLVAAELWIEHIHRHRLT